MLDEVRIEIEQIRQRWAGRQTLIPGGVDSAGMMVRAYQDARDVAYLSTALARVTAERNELLLKGVASRAILVCDDIARLTGERDAAVARADATDDAATQAFDAIAALCGCPTWEYPGRLVRDVETLKVRAEKAEAELARVTKERDEALASAEVAEVARLRQGLRAVETLIAGSTGVAGLHRSGSNAPWSELRTGGKYEAWLRDFDAALSEVKVGAALCARLTDRLNDAEAERDAFAARIDDGTEAWAVWSEGETDRDLEEIVLSDLRAKQAATEYQGGHVRRVLVLDDDDPPAGEQVRNAARVAVVEATP